jgi:carbon monoxide dehydrogenase subunit G
MRSCGAPARAACETLGMSVSTVFEVAVPRDRVVTYLAEPRNLLVANHKGPVLEQSDGPLASGSWFVLGFDQLRARVEYVTFEPPERIAVAVSMSGRGSGGMRSVQEFRLSELEDGRGTRVEATADGTGGWLSWEPLTRVAQRLTWRRLRKQIERSA